MNKVFWIKFIALSGAISVILGAFGAHGLEDYLSERYLDTFKTAVLYQFLHTLALLGVICLPDNLIKDKRRDWIAILFSLGILIFSGSLYALVLLDLPVLGMVTPIGGTMFIVGWLMIFFAVELGD
jgi:uncharacterized membrane protein YgdD (TMEM256/DUF423 family)